ncbi:MULTISPECIES: FtsX-like permease family protein [Cellulomonas]|uniref:ABC transport system permease protein n=1 Tax=Cellulomonas iranensis TaxID=76862 RepID=A0ABU0GHZ0_9CELL|nr:MULTISPECIES: ABC transporter permease [Cellulomonas]MDQ0424983.1 putative ABC transport system permease protein [Cellulomonas iranensis]TFH69870.1 ABC transporter permease [Cellulomonas sp. HD19AZ1]
MFVALRDLRHARGRFALMLVVITLITFLVTFLSSLTAGLARESTSAVTDLPVDHLAFTTPEADGSPDFTASTVTSAQRDVWSAAAGVEGAELLGVATTRAQSAATTAAVTAFGVEPGSTLLPADTPAPTGATVTVSRGAADTLSVAAGDTVSLGGHDLRVERVLDVDASYAHTPVVWVALADWQTIGGRAPASDEGDTATVVAVTGAVDDDTVRRTDAGAGTTTLGVGEARAAISSFSSENGSLLTMQAFLIAISALVVGAFFTVWTISRFGDIAVLKALGASTRYLLRDAIGQALVVLLLGVGLGTGLATVGATLLSGVVPVVVTTTTTLIPAAALISLGLIGAVMAIARITTIDPHAALAAR